MGGEGRSCDRAGQKAVEGVEGGAVRGAPRGEGCFSVAGDIDIDVAERGKMYVSRETVDRCCNSCWGGGGVIKQK